MNKQALLLIAVFAFAASGCKLLKKDAPDAAPPVDTTAQAATDADAGAVAAAVDAAVAPITTTVVAQHPAIPAPQDPDVAAADSARTNYKAELDKIEKQIDSEK